MLLEIVINLLSVISLINFAPLVSFLRYNLLGRKFSEHILGKRKYFRPPVCYSFYAITVSSVTTIYALCILSAAFI